MSFLGNAIEFYVMHNSTHYPKTVTQFDLKINVYIKLNKSLALSIFTVGGILASYYIQK